LPERQPLTCNQLPGITTIDPGPKSFAEATSAPVYQTPVTITFLISLLCECSGLSVPAGTLRICVYAPVFGSPERTLNCIPFLSGDSVHFSSVNDTIIGVLLSFAVTAGLSGLLHAAERIITAVIRKILLI